MSRVGLLEQLYQKNNISNFDYDKLSAPPLYTLIPPEAVQELYKIATSLRYSGNITKKYEMMDKIMNTYGFRKTHAGTNRVVYQCLEIPYIVAKVAVDRVGINDSPAEYKNQNYFKPFCCKIFEVDSTGVIALVEKVNPITAIEEFASVADDIFNLITTKIVGKYALDDIGVTKFMNYGIRPGFGPVILDFPYAYEIDGSKLICNKTIRTKHGEITCGGEIDYDMGFDNLICEKCQRKYQARDLSSDKVKLIIYDKERRHSMTRARIIDGKGNVIKDSGALKSDTYVSKKQLDSYNGTVPKPDENGLIKVDRVIKTKRSSRSYEKHKFYSDLQLMMTKNSNATKARIVGREKPSKVKEDTKHNHSQEPNNPEVKTDDSSSKKIVRGDLEGYTIDCNGIIRYKGKFVSKDTIDKLTEEDMEYIKNNSKASFKNITEEIKIPKGQPIENVTEEIITDKELNEPVITQEYLDKINLFSGGNTEEENDYKDYIPEENNEDEVLDGDEEESVPYKEYIKQFKDKKNNYKPKKINDTDDMEDY